MITVKNNKRGDIIIRIPGPYLRHHVSVCEDFEEGSRITNTKVFSDELVKTLEDEQDDGTNRIHLMLDEAVVEAVEQGAEGIKIGDGDEY